MNFTASGGASLTGDYTQTGAATFDTGTGAGTVSFSASELTKTVTLSPADDTTVENDETAVLTVNSGSGYVVGAPGAATGTITNDDTDVSVTSNTVSIGEDAAGLVTYTFTRAGVTSSTLVLGFTASGAAAPASDYALAGTTSFNTGTGVGSVTFGVGVTQVQVTLDPTADNTVETDELATLTITPAAGFTVTGTPASTTLNNDDSDISISVSPASTLEDTGPNLVYTLTRSSFTTNALDVNVTVSGTAGLTGDYTQTGLVGFNTITGTATVHFNAGSNTALVTIDPSTDSAGESDETVILTLNANAATPAATGGYTPATSPNNAATGTILTDDTSVSVAIGTTPVAESSVTGLIYTFTRTGDTTGALPINFTKGGTTTLPGASGDYTVSSTAGTFDYNAGTLTIPAGSASVTVTLVPVNDTLVEADETAILAVAAGANYGAAGSPATGTITDNDSATVSIAKVNDGAETNTPTNGKFRVTQTGLSSTDTVVNYTIGGTATPGAGNDYTTLTGSVTILAGQTTADIDVPVLNDGIVEGTETVALTLSGFGAHDADITLGAPTNASLDITDNDTATVSIAKVNDGAETNAPTNGKFRVTQTAMSSTDTVVNYTVAGTATAGAGNDYTTLTGSVTILAGQTTADIDVLVLNDSLVEGTETVSLTLTTFGAHDADITLGATTNASLDITDNDTATVSIAKVNDGAETNTPTNGKFRVTQTAISTTDTVVNYTVAGTATAGAGNDYTTLTGSVTILAGQTTADIDVAVLNDGIVEATETVALTLSGFGAHDADITLGAPTNASLDITDNDTATVSIAKVNDGAETNTPTNGKFRVTQTAISSTDTVVNYTVGGTATPGAGNDYSTLTGSVTILAGQTTADIDVAVLNDGIVEITETVSLTLTTFGAHDADITLGAPGTASLDITDDDTATVSIAKFSDAAEPTSTGKFRVTQTAVSSTDTIVSYTVGGTATPGAGNDYTTLTGSVTILAGQTTADIDVAALNDALIEGTETVSATLGTVTGGNPRVTVGSSNTDSLNITDNDTATLSITPDGDANEDGGPKTFNVTLTTSDGAGGTATLGPTISLSADVVDATGGTAISGTDYNVLGTQTVTFATGSGNAATQSFTLTPINDTLLELTETVKFKLQNLSTTLNGQASLGNVDSTINIQDNESATLVIPATANVTEGGGAQPVGVTMTITGSGSGTFALGTGITLTADVVDAGTGTAVSGTDYQAFGTQNVTFDNDAATGTAKNVTVTPIPNGNVDGSRTVNLTLQNLGGSPVARSLGNTGSVVSIIDDDGIDLTLSKEDQGNDDAAAPGDTLVYVLTYDNVGFADAAGVVITETLPDGTTFNAGASTSGWVETAPGSGVYKFTVGSVPVAAAAATVNFAVTVGSTVPAGLANIVNNASIADSGAGGTDINPADNAATDTDTLNAAPDLKIAITDPPFAKRGQKLTYKIAFSNVGNQDATGVVLTETLPANTTIHADSLITGWVETPAGSGIYKFNFGTLVADPAASSVIFAVNVNAVLVPADTIELSTDGAIDDDHLNGPDPDTANNAETEKTPIYNGIYVVSPGIASGKASPPEVRVFNPADGTEIDSFLAYTDAKFKDSIRVAVGDINDDGFDDVITTLASGTGRLKVFFFDPNTNTFALPTVGAFSAEIAVFDGIKDKGAFVAAGDLNGDGQDDIIVGSARGGGKVKVLRRADRRGGHVRFDHHGLFPTLRHQVQGRRARGRGRHQWRRQGRPRGRTGPQGRRGEGLRRQRAPHGDRSEYGDQGFHDHERHQSLQGRCFRGDRQDGQPGLRRPHHRPQHRQAEPGGSLQRHPDQPRRHSPGAGHAHPALRPRSHEAEVQGRRPRRRRRCQRRRHRRHHRRRWRQRRQPGEDLRWRHPRAPPRLQPDRLPRLPQTGHLRRRQLHGAVMA